MLRLSTYIPALVYGLWLAAGAGIATAKDVKTLEIGQPAPDFTLPGVDDREWRLGDFADAKVLVVVFTCNHCPTAQAYEDRIIQMHADYKDKGVALVAISPNNAEAVRLDELGYTDSGRLAAGHEASREAASLPVSVPL